jgi:hypothetical protein
MQRIIPTIGAISRRSRLMPAAATIALLSVFLLAQTGLAQTGTTAPLYFGNNYFVTGDYVVGGVGLRGLGDGSGYAPGIINIPDANWKSNTGTTTGVPPGADIVAAFLYWETVESSQAPYAGQNGFFRGYPISGVVLGNPNAPVAWSSGGCSGNSQGSKTIRAYRAEVSGLLPVAPDGSVQADGSYEVRLADSGSNGAGTPFTLGASLVIIYRVLSPDFPLKSIVIYDGSYSPANGSSTMTQTMQGFYQAASNPVSKLTEIVGNGQYNKYETVYLDGVALSSLYGTQPSFPGFYNGSWDNPTWSFSASSTPPNPLQPDDSFATTMVIPDSSNSGCVSWGAVVVSTTVKDTDHDGLLDVWKQNQGYCDASINGGVCNVGDTTDPGWVPLPGAAKGEKDMFVQMDYMCTSLNSDGTCDASNSLLPNSTALTEVSDAFSRQGINLHLIPDDAHPIPEQMCTDSTDSSGNPVLCPYPGQPGVMGWKGGFVYLKNQPTNTNPDGSTWTETECEQNLDTCVRRFQHGKKDSYHYILFGHALGVPNWSFLGGNLTSVNVSGTSMIFNTTTDPHYDPTTNPTGVEMYPATQGNGNDRVTVSGAISNLSLNGTFPVTAVSSTSFTVQIPDSQSGGPYSLETDPALFAASGHAGTVSGASDVGGQDTAITLDSWGADGQGTSAQAGTFMHELGHSLGLTHGGRYYGGGTGDYTATLGPNCKPNFQSVMNYLFQVDLLGDGTPDYSEQGLDDLSEPDGGSGITPTPDYPTTRWYAPPTTGEVGTPTTRHCDGTPSDVEMYGVEGPTSSITWDPGQDINFDGNNAENLQGYDDWLNIDLRQIGATGSLSTAGGASGIYGFGANGIYGFGASGTYGFGANGSYGFGASGSYGFGASGSYGFGVAGAYGFGTSHGEITQQEANSTTRPPRNLKATVTSSPRYIQLKWDPPTFGQIGQYNIYRGVGVDALPDTTSPYATVTGTPPTTSYTDKDVTCGPMYNYFVTATLAGTITSDAPQGQESVPSNTASSNDCAPPYVFTGFYSPLATADPPNAGSFSGTFNGGKSVTVKWTLQDSSGNLVTDLNANALYVTGPYPVSTSKNAPACSTTQAPLISSYNGNPPANSILYSPTSGAKGNSTFRFSSNQFVFNWDTTGFQTGWCWVLELDLDSGQAPERTSLQLR